MVADKTDMYEKYFNTTFCLGSIFEQNKKYFDENSFQYNILSRFNLLQGRKAKTR